jgi:ubiquitin fusion degradation protein 1
MARDELEKGNKVLLPASVLAEVSQGAMPHPLLFRINSMRTKTTTYVGVLEFTAPEDTCILPLWVSFQLTLRKTPNFLIDFQRNGTHGRRIDQYFPSAHRPKG